MDNQVQPVQHQSFFRKWGGLLVLTLALAIIIIDTTILNVSLKNIIGDLHTDIQSIQWVITIYALILAAFTITGGRLGDLFGRKKMFLLGAVIFALGSFVASISHNIVPLLIGEAVIEGFGAALMMPATASLLVTNFQGRDRAIAFGVWGGVASASAALGPIVGGFLTTHYSWRWAFRINIVIAAVVLLVSFLIKESRDEQEKAQMDWGGVVLSIAGLLSLVFGIIESETYGWFKAKEIFSVAGHAFSLGGMSIAVPAIVFGLIVLAGFVLYERSVERRGRTPLVSMKLFQNRQFTSGSVTTAILGLGSTGLFFAFPIFFQAVRGLDALHTGIALLPMPIGVFLMAMASSSLGKKLQSKYFIQAGFIVSGIGLVVLHQLMKVDATAWHLAPGFLLYGMGFGLIMPHISNLTMSAVPLDQAGEASGVNNTMRQLGATLGSALIGALLLTTLSTNLANGVKASPVIPTQAKQQIAEAVSTQTSNVEFGGGAMLDNQLPEPVRREIQNIGYQATTGANKTTLAYSLIFIIVGLLASLWLPDFKADHGTAPAAQVH
jgi:EmrB/QacA subfamily drug resistance transporter